MSTGGMQEDASAAVVDEAAAATAVAVDDDVVGIESCGGSDTVMVLWSCEHACALLDCADTDASCADDASGAVVGGGGSSEDKRRAIWRPA